MAVRTFENMHFQSFPEMPNKAKQKTFLESEPPLVQALTDPDRLAELSATGLLDSEPDESFDRLTRMVIRLLGVPVALISLVDNRRQFFKSHHGLPSPVAEERQTPLTHSFCQVVVNEGAPLVVNDAPNDPRVCDNLAIPDLGVAAYLGIPLITKSGHVLGSLCAIDTKPRQWTDDDIRLMADIAAIVMSEITLGEEIARRRKAESAQELLIGELHHRVKNTLSNVQALIRLSLNSSQSLLQFRDSIGERIASLAKTHTLLMGQKWHTVGFLDLLRGELDAYQQAGRITFDGPDFDMSSDAATSVGMVIHELTTNASKHGALSTPAGRLNLRWTIEPHAGKPGHHIRLDWIESGGPPVAQQERRSGFGSTLIDRLVTGQFEGTAAFDFAGGGLVFHAEFVIPSAAEFPILQP